MRLRQLIVAASLLTLAVGCGGKDGFIYGKILDARTGDTVNAASIRLGDADVATNEQGFFTIGEVKPDEPLLLSVTADGYARSVKPIVARSGKATYIEVSMLPFVGSAAFDAAAGGSVSAEGAQVTFPAGALNASGTVTANLAVLDASSTEQLRAT